MTRDATGPLSLLGLVAKSGLSPERFICDGLRRVTLDRLAGGSALGTPAESLAGQTVLLHVGRQISAALALLELDGIAGRIVICPPDLALTQFPAVIAKAGVDVILTDDRQLLAGHADGTPIEICGLPIREAPAPARDRRTEWLLFTSGTTGSPKMVIHTLESLTGPMRNVAPANPPTKWSTFYDIRRYGGMQILLRALTCGGCMLLSDPHEAVGDYLTRLGGDGVNQISGTPSHWRRALMSPAIGKISPFYVRLSGEIADQAVLDNLQAAFPSAQVSHAFASTEAGVVFDVRDGRTGFPAAWVGQPNADVEMRIKDGSLQVRSAYTASGYAAEPARRLRDDEGFVDTSDMVELRDGRYVFSGRREGIINVGGLKVHPEEIEAVINLHPQVRMSRVKAKTNPVTGSIVAADIVLRDPESDFPKLRDELSAICRERLSPYKVPAIFRKVAGLEMTAAGKLLRHGA